MPNVILVWIFAFSGLPFIGVAKGQDAPTAPPPPSSTNHPDILPRAQALLDRYFAMTKVFNAPEALSIAGEVSLENLPIAGKVTIYAERGGKVYTRVDLAVIGKIESGSDGTIAWERNPGTGPRIVPKEEAQQNMFGFDPTIARNWNTQFLLETMSEEIVDGQRCFLVRMTPLGAGRPASVCFDADSGFVVKLASTVHNQRGDVVVSQILRDYRDEGGVKIPHEFELVASGLPILMKFKDIKINPELAPDIFDLPDDIRALAKSQGLVGGSIK
jgi:hypothetical protein